MPNHYVDSDQIANVRGVLSEPVCRYGRTARRNWKCKHRTTTGKDRTMKVSEAMTRDVRIASPTETIRQAARVMAEIDAGILPVGENDRLVGMITDRDIAVRAVAAGKPSDTAIRDVMSSDVCYCFDDQEVSDVAANMADIRVRRLPVVSRDKRVVGILSLGDIALADKQARPAVDALCGISEPGGQHSQSGDAHSSA